MLSRRNTSHGRLLLLVETLELRHLALGILAVDLHSAGDEELLLLCRARLPVIWLRDGDCKSHAARPLPVLRLSFALRREWAVERLDRRQLLHVPSLTYAEAPIIVLARLVHSHPSRRPHGDDDQAGLLVGFGAVRGRR